MRRLDGFIHQGSPFRIVVSWRENLAGVRGTREVPLRGVSVNNDVQLPKRALEVQMFEGTSELHAKLYRQCVWGSRSCGVRSSSGHYGKVCRMVKEHTLTFG